MMDTRLSRRAVLALAGALPFVRAQAKGTEVPVGLELYSVREGLKNDVAGTVAAVAKMGYQCVEFYAPYYSWTVEEAKTRRKQLDDLGIKCNSTHNGAPSFTPEGIGKAIELNQILGSRYVVMAHPGKVEGLDGWKRVVETLNRADEKLAAAGLHGGYHNHDLEWRTVDGKMPLEMIASGTGKNFMMQLDVGTCLETGNDPVAWIEKNPGRIRSLHCKEWSKDKGYKAIFGEGSAPWKQIFAAAEKTGGVEYYLIEQEGSAFSEMETARLCLEAWRKV